jgi:threonine dehydratase
MAGQGTIGIELLEDLGEFDAVIIPVGGGGLLSGLAATIKLSNPSVKVYGVGPRGACSMFDSFHQGKIVALNDMPLSLAEALRSPFVGNHCLEHALKYVDDVVTVSDEEIVEAMNLAWTRLKLLVEPGGASSLAAVTAKKINFPAGSKVVCIFSGGNVDLHKLSDIFK